MKPRVWTLLLTALSVFFVMAMGAATSAETLRARAPLGGDVGRMAAHVADIEARGDTVRIDGLCLSSCTMQLLSGCVTPRARLGFHAPHVIEGPATAEIWARFIASHYPAPLADWYLAGPAKARCVVSLTAAQVVVLGARACDVGR